ncbi:hypothetical protein [uncultured Chryseobacterium sp.]|uniref:hypothetical protein n=1 Tax=uncultured Chryseobacterium sp. TaxID=259322 RepID=UPI0025D65797|nr:hypothetical protein [uncultured Chryseobacterium sp.]
MKKIFNLIILLCVVFSISLNASETENRIEARIIEIAGLVTDAGNLKTLEDAKIYDEKGLLIATTDSRGYFKGNIEYPDNGAIHFKIKVQKSGYQSFVQTENWGNLGNNIRCAYYFGITRNDSKSFSEMVFTKDLSIDSVIAGLIKVKEKTYFSKKIETAKKDNQQVFFKIDSEYYLINDGGWLKISSPEDLISIDKNRIVKASEINSLIKRKQIKGMSPSESKEYSYEIYTK